MDKRQKKIISISLQTLAMLVSVIAIIFGILFSLNYFQIDQNTSIAASIWLNTFGVLIEPSFILGIWVKTYLNKKQKKEIKEMLENSNIKTIDKDLSKESTKLPKKAKTLYNGPNNWKLIYNDKKIIIDFSKSEFSDYTHFDNEFKRTIGELLEKVRKKELE